MKKKKGGKKKEDSDVQITALRLQSFFSAKKKAGAGAGVARRGGHDTLREPNPCAGVVLPVATPAAAPSSAGAITLC